MRRNRQRVRLARLPAFFCAVVVLITSSAGMADSALPAPGYAQLPDVVDEASGLTRSLRHPGLFWTHDDNVDLPHSPKGGQPLLFAVDDQGRLHATLKVTAVRRRDWEAVTHVDWRGEPTLIIGDIGDNRDTWPNYRLWFVTEPDISSAQPNPSIEASPRGLIRFRYPDGSHNAESLGVDRASRQILILTKRERPARLFAIPLDSVTPVTRQAGQSARQSVRHAEQQAGKHMVDARPIAILPDLHPTDPISWLLSPIIGQRAYRPTGMALSHDGRRMAVLTYASVYLFERRGGENWQAAMRRPIDSISLPFIDQWEGISFSPDDQSLIIVREGRGARTLLRLSLRPAGGNRHRGHGATSTQ